MVLEFKYVQERMKSNSLLHWFSLLNMWLWKIKELFIIFLLSIDIFLNRSAPPLKEKPNKHDNTHECRLQGNSAINSWLLQTCSIYWAWKKSAPWMDAWMDGWTDGQTDCVAIKLGDKPNIAAGLFDSLILKTRKTTICFYLPAMPVVSTLLFPPFYSAIFSSLQNLFLLIRSSLPLHSLTP